MERQGDEVHFETDEARGASTPNIVRWVLAVSLLAAIVLLSLIWMTGAATQGDEEDEVSVSSMAADPVREDTEATDSIVSEEADEFETAEPGEETTIPTVENEAADVEAPAETN